MSEPKCDDCGHAAETVNEAGQCADCYDAWFTKQWAYWRPLYHGEERAGLLEDTDHD